MKLTCPACNALFTLDAALQGDSARESVLCALAMPAPLSKLLVRYLACFAPAKRQLSWERVAAILNELKAAIEAGSVTRNGRAWAAPQEYWAMALESVLLARDGGKLVLPLKSHGYLFEVIAGLSNRAEALRESEDHKRRAGHTSVATHPSHLAAPAPVVPTERSVMPEEMRAKFVKRKPTGGADE